MNKFDRILWRINGILFLCLLLYSAFVSLSFTFRAASMAPPRNSPKTEMTPEAPGVTAPLHLTFSFTIKGTPFIRTAFETDAEGGKFSSYRQTRDCYNYLYLNSSDLSAWWLFERPNRLITGAHDLKAEPDRNDSPIVATLWEVVTADTDGDHRLTQNDREAVYFCQADGKKPVEIIPPADGVQSFQQVSADRVLIVYRDGDSMKAAIFAVADGSKIKESVLPTKAAN